MGKLAYTTPVMSEEVLKQMSMLQHAGRLHVRVQALLILMRMFQERTSHISYMKEIKVVVMQTTSGL